MEMSSEEKQLPKPKRRRFQLRLRSLLVLVTLASVAFGWVGWELDQRRREKPVIAWVDKMGGVVLFEADPSSGFETSWWKKTNDTLFGESVLVLSIDGTELRDLSPLAELKNLGQLVLSGTKVSDLSPLAGLKPLIPLISLIHR